MQLFGGPFAPASLFKYALAWLIWLIGFLSKEYLVGSKYHGNTSRASDYDFLSPHCEAHWCNSNHLGTHRHTHMGANKPHLHTYTCTHTSVLLHYLPIGGMQLSDFIHNSSQFSVPFLPQTSGIARQKKGDNMVWWHRPLLTKEKGREGEKEVVAGRNKIWLEKTPIKFWAGSCE